MDRRLARRTQHCRVTAAYDSDRQRLIELADAAPWAELEVVVFQHIPLFHTEHCIFDTEVGGRRRNEAPKKLTPEEETARHSAARHRAVSPA